MSIVDFLGTRNEGAFDQRDQTVGDRSDYQRISHVGLCSCAIDSRSAIEVLVYLFVQKVSLSGIVQAIFVTAKMAGDEG